MVITEIFEKYKSNPEKYADSIESALSDLNRFKNKIVLYGAGSSGIAVLYFFRRFDIEPILFIDSNPKKHETYCEGIKVISPDKLEKEKRRDVLVVICINTDGIRYCKSFDEALRVGGHHGVYNSLSDLGYKNIIDYSSFRRCRELFRGEKYNAPSCSDIPLMIDNQKEIEEVYDLLSDDLSKEIYEKIVRFRMIDDSIQIPTQPQTDQYFEDEFYKPRKDASFVDCGAYNGISLETFLKVNGNVFDHYYGTEPDPFNFEKLVKYVSSLPDEIKDNISIIDKAVWEDNNVINLYSLDGPGSFVADIGKDYVKTITIDDMLDGNPATFIKMNIEGSEKQAIAGGENTIKIYSPNMAIAGYHRTEDLWLVPLMVMGFNHRYKVHLRSYMNHISFVYYFTVD